MAPIERTEPRSLGQGERCPKDGGTEGGTLPGVGAGGTAGIWAEER